MHFLSFSVYFALSTLLLHAVIATPLPQPTTIPLYEAEIRSHQRQKRMHQNEEAAFNRLLGHAKANGRQIESKNLDEKIKLVQEKIKKSQQRINACDHHLRMLKLAEPAPEAA